MGSFWVWTGLISMVFMIMGRAILQRFGYKIAVLFTPVIVFIAGVCFFAITMYHQMHPATATDGSGGIGGQDGE
jgi:ATP/ADP translocase